jgi:hypothetical protein
MDSSLADDDVSTTSSTSNRPHSSAPVIIARNIQKFFQNKAAFAQRNSSPKSKTDLDIPALLKDGDLILETRSQEDGQILLRGMVADLLREVDLLRYRLDETSDALKRVKEERDVVNNEYKDRLYALQLALQSTVGNTEAIKDKLLEYENRTANNRSGSKLLSAEEATHLTVSVLTSKIETLNMQLSDKDDHLAKAMETIADLESDSAAKAHKITALEKQFKSINMKRHKIVNSPPPPSFQQPSYETGSTLKQNNTKYLSESSANAVKSLDALDCKPSVPKKVGKVARLVKLVDQM